MTTKQPSGFVHNPLDLTRGTIRVLKIRPGAASTTIECTVRHVPLQRSHICLSYMWGDESNNQTVLLNGRPFRVRYTLWEFLQRARAYGYQADLWIDAICIDQENLQERNHQVRRMAQVYSQAQYVIIWLGCIDGRLIKPVLKASQSLRMTGKVFDIISEAKSDGELFRSPVLHKGVSGLIDQCWRHTMNSIMTSPYWNRLWITQEILLSQDAHIFLGSTTVKLKDIAQFALSSESWSDMAHVSKHGKKRNPLLTMLKSMLGMEPDWHALAKTPLPRTWNKRDSFQFFCRMKYLEEHPHRRLKDLLRQTQLAECFDNPDRIYGIMGLSD